MAVKHRNVPPAKIQRAIVDGAKMIIRHTPPPGTLPTIDDAAVQAPIDDEPSVPMHMAPIDEVVWRLQELQANDIELARQLGTTIGRQIVHEEMLTSIDRALTVLADLATKDDARAEKREEREAKERSERRGDRTKIILAVLGIVGTLAAGGGIGYAIKGNNQPVTAANVPHDR